MFRSLCFRSGYQKNLDSFWGSHLKTEVTSRNTLLVSLHPETPSPLVGEGWGEGDENRKP